MMNRWIHLDYSPESVWLPVQIGGVQRIFHAHLLGFELKGYQQMHQAAVEHFSSGDGWDIGYQRTLISKYYLIKVHILFNFIRINSGIKSCHPPHHSKDVSCNFPNSFGKSLLSSNDLRTRWTQRSSICSWIYGLPWPWDVKRWVLTPWSQELAQRSAQKENLGPALVSLCQAHSRIFWKL